MIARICRGILDARKGILDARRIILDGRRGILGWLCKENRPSCREGGSYGLGSC